MDGWMDGCHVAIRAVIINLCSGPGPWRPDGPLWWGDTVSPVVDGPRCSLVFLQQAYLQGVAPRCLWAYLTAAAWWRFLQDRRQSPRSRFLRIALCEKKHKGVEERGEDGGDKAAARIHFLLEASCGNRTSLLSRSAPVQRSSPKEERVHAAYGSWNQNN